LSTQNVRKRKEENYLVTKDLHHRYVFSQCVQPGEKAAARFQNQNKKPVFETGLLG